MKAIKVGLAGALLVAGLGLAPALPAAAATTAPYCGITWGSLADSHGSSSSARVTGVRTGEHACFDRLVVDLKGKVKGYDVKYVNAVRTEGQGRRVPLTGAADLQILVASPASTSYAPAHRTKAADVTGYRTFGQVAYLGSFEGRSSFGLGVRARLPFRTFVLDGPGTGSRLVIDVAHRW
ncbi:MAG: AMIN-like domain-containing (lipo)protein [Arthrobacter sp.]|uniref:AMIN-like domain-containing (lipo)protein n=1 Tax=unclassified Arthrobacter TaxID=235627 RepID=UPI00264F0E15|nr:hypothetical protein [Micrococcaceae bacterium]MDN5886173.1 hypothetical protein [Micrococcaceae bacterium]MDN6179104.1 hypothetical protein [Micrococcaceae bacterium]MDN6201581.1 hypothetical protein [Micrococcaceae bacterium]MDN6300093.1 hypothetical protein [Micrococcaceae bacterium]